MTDATQASDADIPERYSRQSRFAGLGPTGQRKLMKSRVTLIGSGALGSVLAEGLVRAGVGFLRLIDRDFVELNNLQRQQLFEERDALERLPKATAAAEKLARINSSVSVEPIIADVHEGNIAAFADGAQLLLDGTDNFETRFLINDFSIFSGIPWVYAGCLGAEGHTMTIVPGVTPCWRCVVESAPAPGTAPTCESAGIIAPASALIAQLQLAEALKILSGNLEAINRDLVVVNVWENTFRRIKLTGLASRTNCPVCVRREFDYLNGKMGQHTTRLCGRNAVQVMPPVGIALDWVTLEKRLREVGTVTVNPFLVRLQIPDYELSIFRDGRAIIKGTEDVAVARSIYARYLGA